jgi:predicted nucleotidyltransferase component of viral defense system
MGTNQPLAFNEERQLHVDIMRAIARELHDIPMVLKGGTALLLCYGLDRFSEDLDFDAPKKFNIAGRVEKILSQKAKGHGIRTVKDTETVQRLKAHYTGLTSDRLLKIETSFRTPPTEEQTTVIDGIRTYSVGTLIAQKINALEHRTAARDLYDIAFLTRQYAEKFSTESIQKLGELMADVNAVEQRFHEAFEEDEILDASRLMEIIFQITEFLNHQP